MKTIISILIILLLTGVIYSQNRLVRQSELVDSLAKYLAEEAYADSFLANINRTSIDQIKEVQDYEPVMQDSTGFLYVSGVWTMFDFGQALVAAMASAVVITYPDANTISFNDVDQIVLDPADLEIDGSNQLSIVGGAPLAQTAFADSLNANFYTGTDSIHYGQDSIVVTHGVGSAPSFVDIQEMSDAFGFRIWVNVIGATTFSVKRNDPTVLEEPTTYIKFRWLAYK